MGFGKRAQQNQPLLRKPGARSVLTTTRTASSDKAFQFTPVTQLPDSLRMLLLRARRIVQVAPVPLWAQYSWLIPRSFACVLKECGL